MSKKSGRCVPHNFNDAQKQHELNDVLADNKIGSRIIYIFSGDESCIYMFNPETERQSDVCLFQSEPEHTN